MKIRPAFNGRELSTATGFGYKANGRNHLVTNWHVLAGRHVVTRQPLDKRHGGIPNELKLDLLQVESGHIIGRIQHTVALQNSAGENLWYEHPLGPEVDIGVLPLPQDLPTNSAFMAINDLKFNDIRIEVSLEVFILGYPEGVEGILGLPIWKRGSIAANIGANHHHRILVDTATRQGMSGSPAIYRFNGFYRHDPTQEMPAGNDFIGTAEVFLGVYSGRILGEDEFAAQLGVVWKAHLIEEIIAAKRPYVEGPIPS